jgi:arylsulfatase A-like enzyme
MIVRIPGKWQQLSSFSPGSRVSELVSFVDLAPTVLSLCGVEKPSYMQGHAFLGSKRSEAQKDPTVFLYADRFDEIYGMRRGITNGRYNYIRYFTP